MRGQRLLDNAPCQAVAGLDSGALLFLRYCASLVQTKADRHANGSPSGGAGEELATRLRGQGFGIPEGAKNPPFGDGAPGGGLSFWVSQWTHLLLPLSLLLYAILPKSQALHRKFTVTLLLAGPVSFWRKEWYNGFAVHPAYLTGEEVDALAYFLTFLVSVGADVVSHFICKWLDRCEENRKA